MMPDEQLDRIDEQLDSFDSLRKEMINEQESRRKWRIAAIAVVIILSILTSIAVGIAIYNGQHGENERKKICMAVYGIADGLVASGTTPRPGQPPRTPEEQRLLEERIDAFYADLDRRLSSICSPPSRQ